MVSTKVPYQAGMYGGESIEKKLGRLFFWQAVQDRFGASFTSGKYLALASGEAGDAMTLHGLGVPYENIILAEKDKDACLAARKKVPLVHVYNEDVLSTAHRFPIGDFSAVFLDYCGTISEESLNKSVSVSDYLRAQALLGIGVFTGRESNLEKMPDTGDSFTRRAEYLSQEMRKRAGLRPFRFFKYVAVHERSRAPMCIYMGCRAGYAKSPDTYIIPSGPEAKQLLASWFKHYDEEKMDVASIFNIPVSSLAPMRAHITRGTYKLGGNMMTTAVNETEKVKAVVFSNYDKHRYETEYRKKLERCGIDILRVMFPDRGFPAVLPDGVKLVIALVGMMSNAQIAVIKRWADTNGCRYVPLDKYSSSWPKALGFSPVQNLHLMPPARDSQEAEIIVAEPEPAKEVKMQDKELEDLQELVKLYAIENAELKTELKTKVEWLTSIANTSQEEIEKLTKTRQKNGAALAAKTKQVVKLEEENLRLYEEVRELRNHKSDGGDHGDIIRKLEEKVRELESELGAKRRTMNTWEAKMREMVEEKRNLEIQLAEARERLARGNAQPVKEVVTEIVKEVVVGTETIQRLIMSLQTMVDENMMTPEEALRKLSAKYR